MTAPLSGPRRYACENCTWTGTHDTGREAMWHAAENGHLTYDVATRESALEGATLPPHPTMDEEVDPAEVAQIRKQHRHYAMNQLRDKAALMAREYDRDVAAGKLSGATKARAAARVESYADLVTTLTKLKGLI